MRTQLIATAVGGLTFLAAGAASAGAPAPLPLQVPNPTYTTVNMEIDVARPAAQVYQRIGKYCDIGEWFPGLNCQITSGKDGEVGTVRVLNGTIVEILVGKTELSHTYTQPVRVGRNYDMYHGTIEVRPTGANSSKIVYTLMFDNSALADDAAREADRNNRRTRFMDGLRNMKTLAEGGTVPRPAPPAAPAR